MPSSVLMCPPDFYGTSFFLNPWMDYREADVDPDAALEQWTALEHAIVEAGCDVQLIDPAPDSPPMVFTADGALVYSTERALVLRNDGTRSFFEPRHLAAWLETQGLATEALPPAYRIDGGNVLRLASDSYLIGLKPGSPGLAERYVAKLLGRVCGAEMRPLALYDSRFLHLDMVVGNLAGRGLLVYWDGLHPESRKHLAQWAGNIPLIAVDTEDARRFACNCVPVGNGRIITGQISSALTEAIESLGLEVVRTGLPEFYKAGGGAKCLTLPVRYRDQ